MAIASCSVKIISRGAGRSAVAAAAYRSGEELENEFEGTIYNYGHKKGIVHTEILAPSNAPEWVYDRQKLWNAVELFENRKNARLAREVMIALPKELTQEQRIELVRDYARIFVRMGMIADIAIHDKGDGNPHAHIMLTDRELDGDHFADKKNREWNSRENVEIWREQYASITNKYLERYNHPERIDHRSYERQGIDQTPTIHKGHYAHSQEQQGIRTELGDKNRQIEAENREREWKKQFEKDLALVKEAQRQEPYREQRELEKQQAEQRKQQEAAQLQQAEILKRRQETYQRHKRTFLKRSHLQKPTRSLEPQKQDWQAIKERREAQKADYWQHIKAEQEKQKTLEQLAREQELRRKGLLSRLAQGEPSKANWQNIQAEIERNRIDWQKLKEQREAERPEWARQAEAKQQQQELEAIMREAAELEARKRYARYEPEERRLLEAEFGRKGRQTDADLYEQAKQERNRQEQGRQHPHSPITEQETPHKRPMKDLYKTPDRSYTGSREHEPERDNEPEPDL